MNEFVTVLSAEMMRRLRSRIFFIGLLIGMLAVALIARMPSFVDSALQKASNSIVLAGEPGLLEKAVPLLSKDFKIVAVTHNIVVPTTAYLDRHQAAFAVLILRREAQQLRVTAYARDLSLLGTHTIESDLAPLNVALATALSQARVNTLLHVPIEAHPVGSKFSNQQSADTAKAVAYMLIFFLYISILLNSQLVTSSVAEEKTSRIAELLVSSVNPSALLMGKIAAAGILALIQMASWLLVGVLVAPHTQPQATAGMGLAGVPIAPAAIFAFISYFLLGYLQYSMIYAAAASLINRVEDLGSITGPIVMPVVGAFFLALYALGFPNAPITVAGSLIPMLAPFVMFARIAVADVPGWQVALSLLINICAVVGIAWIAGKIYRVGMLLYGRPPKLKQVFATLRF